MYLPARNEKKSSGVVAGPLLVGRFGALTSPLNPAFMQSGAGQKVNWAERWAGLP